MENKSFHYNILAAVLLLSIFVLSIAFFTRAQPVWWALTQITSWSLVLHVAYFGLNCIILLRQRSMLNCARFLLKRDRFFAVNMALSSGVACFFLTVVLPFTPKYLHLSFTCDSSSESCTAVHAFIVLCLANLAPLAIMLADMFYIDHRFSYRNTWVEFGALSSLIFIYLVWSIVCSAVNHDWPYQVQANLKDNLFLVFLIQFIMISLLLGFYFLWARICVKLWQKRRSHYTDTLLTEIEQTWDEQPIQEFEVNVFPTNGTEEADDPRKRDQPNPHSPDGRGVDMEEIVRDPSGVDFASSPVHSSTSSLNGDESHLSLQTVQL